MTIQHKQRYGHSRALVRVSAMFPMPCLLMLLCASSLFFPKSILAQSAGDTRLELATGQQKVIATPGVSRIAVADPRVADVKVINQNQILITAVGTGRTEITVWKGPRTTVYEIFVSTKDIKQLRREVTRLLGKSDSMAVKVVGDKVWIEGQVLTFNDLEQADEIARMFPQVQSYVKLDPSAHNQIADAINSELDRAGLQNSRAIVVGGTVFLEGFVNSESDMKKAELLTRSIGPNIQNMLSIGASRMVELDVEFVEMSKNRLNEIGIRWPLNISGTVGLQYNRSDVLTGLAPNAQGIETTGDISTSLGLSMQFNDGNTRVLAHPRLVTASGKEATFLAGGEIPIPIVTAQQTYVEFKEYGVRLKMTPQADAAGNISARILAEVSDIDDAVQVMGVPGILTRRVDTEVTVRDGETIVLSGLYQLAEGKEVVKVPLLGHIPIIGELFKSRAFRKRETELVVFVTPRIVDPLSKHLRDLSSDILKRYEKAKKNIKFSIFD